MRRRISVQFMAGITVTLVLTLSANLVVVWRQMQGELLTQMHGQAQTVAQQLIATRLFIARNQDRINSSSTGHVEFKGLNPAAVGRGVGAIFNEETGARIKQTNFQVRRPENAPDSFEWEALSRFANEPGLTEYYRQTEEGGRPFYRYAVPLTIQKECLVCHGGPAGALDIAGYPKEGYQVGQIGGAISVALPMEGAMARIERLTLNQLAAIGLITALSLLVIHLLSRYLVATPLERLAQVASAIGGGNLALRDADLQRLHRSKEMAVVAESISAMARSLHELYTDLEAKVAERTRELAQANQVQSQFFATVSHELRTPLTSIIAFTELLQKRAEGTDREYLEDIHQSSSRLLEMVNNLLDISRLRAGRIELFLDVADLPDLIAATDRSLRVLAEKKGITLKAMPMKGLPPVMVDPIRIQQVLINLVGNAVKFTPDGGEITVDAFREGGRVTVRVRDSGPGIPPELRSAIFEPFRRVESPGRTHPGSGLGLAVARELVELHGGRIWVEAADGGGSLFCFTLPALTRTGEEDEPPCP